LNKVVIKDNCFGQTVKKKTFI